MEILGNGAFGTVRMCSRATGNKSPTKFRDMNGKKGVESQIVK